jgi:hypothetical protein
MSLLTSISLFEGHDQIVQSFGKVSRTDGHSSDSRGICFVVGYFSGDMTEMMDIDDHKMRIEGKLLKVARLDAERFLYLDDPEPLIESLRKARSRVDLFTFIQKPSETQPKYGYPMEWDNLAVLTVSSFDNWWTKQVDAKTRNIVRKSEKKGVVLREMPFSESLVRDIWEIYNETPIRQGRRFSHYGKDYETVYREAATYPEHSVFVGAFLDAKLIGFIRLLLSADRSQAGLLNIVSLIEHRDKSPTNALVAYAVRFCANRKIPYLTYSTFSYGRRQGDSLSEFKEHNAFQRVDVPRYYVPLTLFGRVAFRLGSHKKLLDRIPEPAIIKFRELRSDWYARSLRTINKSS